MKITNKNVASIILIAILILTNYCTYYYGLVEWKEDWFIANLITAFVLDFLLLFGMLLNEIRFEITIPNPFKNMADYYRQKKEYLIELDNVMQKMAKTDSNEELDLLIRKKEIIENHLGIQ